ncbi:MAG: 2Fe-2S iron-sulfur cluster-binding protein [Sporichthyaceae bacterium]
MPRITVEPFAHSFECADGETVLAGALRNNLLLRYGCQYGGCGTCKVRLVDGDVEEPGSSFALTTQDREEDLILACASVPLEDCVLDVEPNGVSEEQFHSGDTSKPYETVVESVEYLTADIAGVRLRIVGDRMPFVAGQFVNVEIPGTALVRTFSLANAPAADDVVELIVKLYPDGAFSHFLRETAAPGTPVRVHGPYGQLRIRLSHRPVLMIAGGSGLAPILSLLRDCADRGFDRPITFFFGARSEADLYLQDEIAAVGARLPEFAFHPVTDGFVTDAITAWSPTLAHDVYLCGPPPMISAAVPLLTGAGVRPRNVYFDAFTQAVAVAVPASI